jgi:hypothetical protein
MPTRRELLAGAAAAGALLTSIDAFAGDLKAPARPVAAGDHKIVPLPFKPDRLKGSRERCRPHHANNYSGAVKNPNKVSRAATVTKDTPGSRSRAARARAGP